MPRRRRATAEQPEPLSQPTVTTNGPSPDDLHAAIMAVEDCLGDLERENERARAARKVIRETAASEYAQAEERGIPKAILKNLILERVEERKQMARRAKLAEEEQLRLDSLRRLLGGLANLPLGAAAIEREVSQNGEQALANVGA
jgi:hypothetical protein